LYVVSLTKTYRSNRSVVKGGRTVLPQFYQDSLFKLCVLFLANVNSRSRSRRYMLSSVRLSVCPSVRLSVVCLSQSVTFVRPTQAVEIFGNVSTPFSSLAICIWHPGKLLRRSSQENRSIGGIKRNRGSQI